MVTPEAEKEADKKLDRLDKQLGDEIETALNYDEEETTPEKDKTKDMTKEEKEQFKIDEEKRQRKRRI